MITLADDDTLLQEFSIISFESKYEFWDNSGENV